MENCIKHEANKYHPPFDVIHLKSLYLEARRSRGGERAGTWRTGCLKVTIFTYLHFANKTSSGKLTFKIQFVRTWDSSLKFSAQLDRRMT